MTNPKLIHLPISVNYVEHWGFWEAMREILQNAIDTGDYKILQNTGKIRIKTYSGALDISTLMLGESTKRDDNTTIGKYGEGYKLALLVLCRLGCNVTVRNGSDRWDVYISQHPVMGKDCLTIAIHEGVSESSPEELVFTVTGITAEWKNQLRNNHISMDDMLIKAEFEGSYCFTDPTTPKKRVYVSGLYVCDLPESENYLYSYNFKPEILTLDRDRSSVDSFYLQYEATKLISSAGEMKLLAKMANARAKDISDYYCSGSYGGYGSSAQHKAEVNKFAAEGFYARHGANAYPIKQDMYSDKKLALQNAVVAAGMVPIEVNKALYDMLPEEMKKKLVIPKLRNKVSDELQAILLRNKKHMRSKPNKELTELVNILKLNGM